MFYIYIIKVKKSVVSKWNIKIMFAIRLGFTEIKELDEYVGLKCLYLECNAISEISGLEKLTELRCLLLHNNVIKVYKLFKNIVCHFRLIIIISDCVVITENRELRALCSFGFDKPFS